MPKNSSSDGNGISIIHGKKTKKAKVKDCKPRFLYLEGEYFMKWTALKKALRFPTDALFLEYLLMLAEKILTKKKKSVNDIENRSIHEESQDGGINNKTGCTSSNKRLLDVQLFNLAGETEIAKNITHLVQEEVEEQEDTKVIMEDIDVDSEDKKTQIITESSEVSEDESLISGPAIFPADELVPGESMATSQTDGCQGQLCDTQNCDNILTDSTLKVVSDEEAPPNLDSEHSNGPIQTRSKRRVSRIESEEEGERKLVGFEQEKESGSQMQMRVSIKIKLCHQCNTRHVVGAECSTQKQECVVNFTVESKPSVIPEECDTTTFNEVILKDVSENIRQWNKENTNIYDFDETEKELGEERDHSSSWCCNTTATGDHSKVNGESMTTVKKSRVGCFAESTLADDLILKFKNKKHGLSVFTKSLIKEGVKFGPLVGQKKKQMEIADDADMKDIWEVPGDAGVTFFSTQDAEVSNWLRYLRPGESQAASNLISLINNNELFFVTTRDISRSEELTYWMQDTNSGWPKKKLEKTSCGGCNIQFGHALYFRKHCLLFHDPNHSLTTRKYHCKVCGLEVLGKEKIVRHAVDKHDGKGAYQCQFCFKFFLRLNYLDVHKTYGCSLNPRRARPLCDLCGQKFCQPQKLKIHMKRMHSDMAEVLKNFQCKKCMKVLGSQAALHRHTKEVHKKDVVGASACERCGKMFQNKSNLKIHMLTHSGVKPFRCQQGKCKSAFTTKQCLQLHYKKIHGLSGRGIPKIERSIAYTFDAYSGGTMTDPVAASLDQPQASTDDLIDNVPDLSDRENSHLSGVTSPLSVGCGADEALSVSAPVPCHEHHQQFLSDCDAPQFQSIATTPHDPTYDSLAEECFEGTPKPEEPELGSPETHVRVVQKEDEGEEVEGVMEEVEERQSERWTSSPRDEDDLVVGKEETLPLMEPSAEAYSMHPYIGGYEPRTSFQDTDPPKDTFLRMNGSPLHDIPRDYNINSLIKEPDPESESLAEIEIQDLRSRELLESDAFHDQYRTHKLDLYRSGEPDYREMELASECYRGLDKYRGGDAYRLRGEGYEVGQVQNLCLKEKNLQLDLTYKQYDTLEELTRIGRDASAFECLLVTDCVAGSSGQTLAGVSRGLHGMLSPRAYHTPTYESESVDLSVPRHTYPSPPVYSLDLTPSRIEVPTARHMDLRSHLGLSPHRYTTTRTVPMVPTAVPAPQVSPTGYGVYQPSYSSTPGRLSPQYHPYSAYY